MNPRRTLLLWCLGLWLAACGGGSGSTGLITSEGALIDDVRRTGTCDEFDGAPYCATDSPQATAPGGQSASVVSSGGPPTPVRTATSAASPTPGGGATATAANATATAGGAPSPTPVGTPGGSSSTPQATATPAGGKTSTPAAVPTVTPTPAVRSVTVAVDGFASGAACATAARAAGSEDVWRTAALVAVDDSGAAVSFPLPAGVVDPLDLTLLCFDDPPAAVPPLLATLADANPTVVFVLPSS
jgi:hypothetical protein